MLLRLTVIAMVVLCLADWVLVEDLGIFGGLGTDPNSMIPQILLGVAGYLALTGAPAIAAEPEAPTESAAGESRPGSQRPGSHRATRNWPRPGAGSPGDSARLGWRRLSEGSVRRAPGPS